MFKKTIDEYRYIATYFNFLGSMTVSATNSSRIHLVPVINVWVFFLFLFFFFFFDRPGFCAVEFYDVPAGQYHIIPTTFRPQCEGPFFLEVSSSSKVTLRKL